MYELLDPTEIRPEGWFRDQLTIQARGLRGNLDKVWLNYDDYRVALGKTEEKTLCPYGCAKLRVAELPVCREKK